MTDPIWLQEIRARTESGYRTPATSDEGRLLAYIDDLHKERSKLRFLAKITMHFIKEASNKDIRLVLELGALSGLRKFLVDNQDVWADIDEPMMPEQPPRPPPIEVDSAEFRANPDKYVQQAGERTVVIMRDGEPRSYIMGRYD